MVIGNDRIYLSAVDSTNLYIKRLISDVIPGNGLVVYTDHQYGGIGQYGSQWESQKGKNVAFSIFNKPKFLNSSYVFTLNMIICIGLIKGIQHLIGDHKAKIKWPNDILVHNRKIAGVLIQNTFRKGNVEHSIIGIGINVNQLKFSKHDRRAVSLAMLNGQETSIPLVLNTMLQYIDTHLKIIDQPQKPEILFERLKVEYLSLLYTYGDWHMFKNNTGDSFEARVKDIESDGKIVVETREKNIGKYGLKELSW